VPRRHRSSCGSFRYAAASSVLTCCRATAAVSCKRGGVAGATAAAAAAAAAASLRAHHEAAAAVASTAADDAPGQLRHQPCQSCQPADTLQSCRSFPLRGGQRSCLGRFSVTADATTHQHYTAAVLPQLPAWPCAPSSCRRGRQHWRLTPPQQQQLQLSFSCHSWQPADILLP